MQNIIDQSDLRDDCWQQDVIVPVAHWLAECDRLSARQGRTAVWLSAESDPAVLQPTLHLLPLVAIDFPSFTDGRGYSSARLLRERYSYTGELRAIGDVWHDHFQALWLVGFDSFEIKSGKPLPRSAQAARPFSEHYQASFRELRPLFRRCINIG